MSSSVSRFGMTRLDADARRERALEDVADGVVALDVEDERLAEHAADGSASFARSSVDERRRARRRA